MPKGSEVKLPKTLAACADRLYTLKTAKSAAQKVVDEIEAEAAALREHLIKSLPKGEASGISGKLARVTLVVKAVPQVEDWDAFHAFVAKKKAWELMQKRVSTAAITELWEDGKTIPGIVQFQTTTVSLNKVS